MQDKAKAVQCLPHPPNPIFSLTCGMKRLSFALGALAFGLQACTPHAWMREQPVAAAVQDAPIAHSLLLIGDCGKPSHDPGEPSLRLLGEMAKDAGAKGTVLFLGDNVYDRGLPDATASNRKEMETRLLAQTEAVKASGCRLLMVPGNHDWDMMGKEGWEAVKREEQFVEDAWAAGNTFLPDLGCPGPALVHPAKGITLVLLDSQWWMHQHAKPGKADGCTVGSKEEFLTALRDSLAAHSKEQLVVAAHHPVWTYGTHGGHFGPKYHLFPLLMFKKNLYVPLPVLGSLAVWFRKAFGNSTDCSHPIYKRYRKSLREIFAQHPGLIYVSGHEHNLQYSREGEAHHVVSGSGTKSQSVGHGKYAQFTHGAKGFARLDFLEDGGQRLSFVLPQGGCTVEWTTRLK